MSVAVCPGSFDPFTLGHLDMVRQTLAFADSVVIAVANNCAKNTLFVAEKRVKLIQSTLREADLDTYVSVAVVDGLIAEFCKKQRIDVIVKGLRHAADFDYEFPMSQMNRQLGSPPTVYVGCKPSLIHISSSLVKEVASYGVDVRGMVNEDTAKELYSVFNVKPPFGGDNVIAANFEHNKEGKYS